MKAIVIGVVVAIIAVFGIATYVHYANLGVRMENGIKAAYDDNKNVLGQYSLKVVETAKVTGKFADDLARVTSEALEGRYGENGSRAVFNWIQENYPGQLDASLYANVQRVIEAGRKDFEVKQRTLIDQKRVYQNQLDFVWSGFWLGVAGYPKIKLEDFKILTSEHAEESYKSGIEKPVEF